MPLSSVKLNRHICNQFQGTLATATIIVTGSAKRGLIAFLNFQLQLVTTYSMFSLLMYNCSQEQNHVKTVT